MAKHVFTKEEVHELVEKENVHFLRVMFSDLFGTTKSVDLPVSQLDKLMNNKMMFDGSSIDGFVRINESDMYLYPDMSTWLVFPWGEEHGKVARVICSVHMTDGTPFAGDPRNNLIRVLDDMKKAGFTSFNIGPEPEFFLFKTDEKGNPTTEVNDNENYFDMEPADAGENCRRDIVLALEKMGFDVEAAHHEVAPGQHEVDFKYANALEAADNIQTFKFVVKSVAKKHGLHATFMPKPLSGINGSGMHTNMSLFDKDGNNAFYDPDDPQGYRLSKVAKRYLAGLLKYAPEFCAITNQHVNSYKRLIAGGEAPIYLSWARSNRSTLVRVPGYRPASEGACRLELRSPDPSANPYLAFAVMLAAGLAGIEEELELQEPNEDQDLFMLSRQDLRQQGIATLPESLGEAVELFAESELMRATLGDHIHSYLVAAKRAEWNDYQGYVSQWERDRYLAVL